MYTCTAVCSMSYTVCVCVCRRAPSSSPAHPHRWGGAWASGWSAPPRSPLCRSVPFRSSLFRCFFMRMRAGVCILWRRGDEERDEGSPSCVLSAGGVNGLLTSANAYASSPPAPTCTTVCPLRVHRCACEQGRRGGGRVPQASGTCSESHGSTNSVVRKALCDPRSLSQAQQTHTHKHTHKHTNERTNDRNLPLPLNVA